MNGLLTSVKEAIVARREALVGAAIGATATLAIGFGIKAVNAAKGIIASEDAEATEEATVEPTEEDVTEEVTDSIE